MAAGGLAAALGGNNLHVEYAAEIGMEHNLGMTLTEGSRHRQLEFTGELTPPEFAARKDNRRCYRKFRSFACILLSKLSVTTCD
jgi:hypothetical protein